MRHSEFTPHAYITLSNMGGIEIMLNRSNDGAYYRFNYGQPLEGEEIFESEIQYDQEGEAYFMHITEGGEGVAYYLNEAMRIDYPAIY